MERAADLFIEQDVSGEFVMSKFVPMAYSPNDACPVRLEHFEQIFLILFSLGNFHVPTDKCQLCPFNSHAAINRRIGEFHPAVDRVSTGPV